MTESPPKRGSKLACNACRKLKIKCRSNEDSTVCVRCSNLGLECVYLEHHRGRRLRVGELPRETNSPIPNRIITKDPSSSSFSSHGKRRASEVQAAYSLANILLSTEDDYKSPESLESPARKARRVSLGPGGQEFHVENAVVEDQERIWQHQDLIRQGVFTENEAEQLFDLFMTRQNPFIALLDPRHHTFDSVRATSPALFTAILAVSSKFVDTSDGLEKYIRCKEVATRLVSEGMGRNVLSIGFLQAISLLSYWKESSDGSAWSKIGFAVRLGYELGLDQGYPTQLPADVRKARSLVAKERTWLQIYMFDRTVSAQRGKPCAMVHAPVWSPQKWYKLRRSQGYATGADAFLTATYAFIPITDATRLMRRLLSQQSTTPGEAVTIQMTERKVEHDIQEWDREWMSLVLSDAPPQSQLAMRFHRLAFELQWQETCMNSRKHRSASTSDQNHNGLSLCTGAAIDLLTFVVEEFGSNRMLRYVQDIVILGTSSAGVWLFTHIGQLPSNIQDRVSKLFRSVATTCSNAAKDHEDPCAYLARLFIGFSKLPSRTVSRRPSPGPEDATRGPQNDFVAQVPLWSGSVSIQDLFATNTMMQPPSLVDHSDFAQATTIDPGSSWMHSTGTGTGNGGLFDISGEELALQVAEDSQFWNTFIGPDP